jgi:Ca-activated chloride channel family protein
VIDLDSGAAGKSALEEIKVDNNHNRYQLERWLAFLLSLLFLLPIFARGDELARLDDTTRPELLIKTSRPGLFVAAPAVKTDITLEIRGVIARGRIHQRFTNPTDHCVEALYAFPLPDNAAVDSLTITVGNRKVEGEIKERQEAQKTYEQAKSEGKSASLLEQHRPNLFTMSVASIGAGETVDVEIGYGQTLIYDDGRFSIRFPLAIGPRYDPGVTPDAAQATTSPLPPMLHQATSKARNPVSITVDLDAGIPLTDVKSATHAIESSMLSATRWNVTLKEGSIASDRDFDLTWTPRLGSEPKAAMFTEELGGHRYALMMLFPQDTSLAPAAVLPRETIFIIDTSGSMGGPSIDQARRALTMAIDRLRPGDTFNVIEFNDKATRVFESPRPADRTNVETAKAWVGKLEAGGGTEMLPALQMALEGTHRSDVVRQVIFMTDGQVGNENQLLDYIRTHLGDSRLFTVGIGPAPNAFFLRSGARGGRGTFTAIGNLEELEEKMKGLFRKLESPTLSNIEVKISDPAAEVWPSRIGDLYAGEPLVVAARFASRDARIGVHGRSGTKLWSEEMNGGVPPSPQAGIAKLWARQKIDSILDANASSNSEAAQKEVVAIGLEYHLVTPFTSLVAVDVTPKGVDPATCTSELVPINLPDGWGGRDADGSLPRTATPGKVILLLGILFLLMGTIVVRSV